MDQSELERALQKGTIEEHQLERALQKGTIEEHQLDGVEFKESWEQRHGRVISALSSRQGNTPTWIVVGVSDKGQEKRHF